MVQHSKIVILIGLLIGVGGEMYVSPPIRMLSIERHPTIV
jgi:hypothetical protein